jgi:hypothetical protein
MHYEYYCTQTLAGRNTSVISNSAQVRNAFVLTDWDPYDAYLADLCCRYQYGVQYLL